MNADPIVLSDEHAQAVADAMRPATGGLDERVFGPPGVEQKMVICNEHAPCPACLLDGWRSW